MSEEFKKLFDEIRALIEQRDPTSFSQLRDRKGQTQGATVHFCVDGDEYVGIFLKVS